MVRQRRGQLVAVALAALSLTAVVLLAKQRVDRVPRPPTSPGVEARVALFTLEDGSAVSAVSEGAQVDPVEVGPGAVAVRLARGAARFSVTPNRQRTFRVLAGDVTVSVLGTIFSVGIEPDGVRVGVERGRVHVAWPAGNRDLAVGEVVISQWARKPSFARQ
jgi:transmembrane sensor